VGYSSRNRNMRKNKAGFQIICSLAAVAIVAGTGCFMGSYTTKAPDYNEIALDYDRTRFGNAPFPFWMHLTPFEIRTLLDAEKAKAGDPEALLALGLVASGNVRDSAKFLMYHERVSRFISANRPDIDAQPDEWQKGFRLYQAMRKEFLVKDSVNELAGYDWFKSGLSSIFENGSYNCISSAMLYLILARYFSLNVKGVLLPTHAFVQFTRASGKSIEIETTSKRGFDWIHDEQYYKTQSAGWFLARGLPASTYEEYVRRVIVLPYQLICHNMTNQHTDVRHMRVEDIHRLKEIQAYVETSNAQYQRERLVVYQADFAHLQNTGDYKTAERMFTSIRPVVEWAKKSFGKDTAIFNVAARMEGNRQGVLFKLKNYDEFLGTTKSLLAAIPHVTADSAVLLNNCLSNTYNFLAQCVDSREFDKMETLTEILAPYAGTVSWVNQNLQWALGMEMQHYWNKGDWSGVVRVCKKQLQRAIGPESRKIARSNMEGAFCNWSNIYINEGNWPKARDVLRQCEQDLAPDKGQCSKYLRDLEAAHRF
jgi:hypothetical protein